MTPQIQDPALAERLRRKFAIVGSGGIDTIAPELVGVVVVDQVMPAVERFEGFKSTQVVGDTGDIPEIGIINESTVDLLVIDQVIISVSAVGVVRLRLGEVAGTAVVTVQSFARDQTSQVQVPASGDDATNSLGSNGTGEIVMFTRTLANVMNVWKPNLVLDVNGAANDRDRCHCDAALTAATLNVTYLFHFTPPPLQRAT